ncbi:flagellar biosynthesis protein FlhF [Virgibacillus profundi]|uniref:Flagellar biosynthesis protein FlhF n=1 Tax=Virgibacillus profundi TaxID=2024555 RepID=A0A2A2IF90_9BACI|nr:flagellar biosynthesis protein FlhF [Virgibacillus profundi]PAV30018.1 flagellar biosynthesis protein FlhF [Virgibacillus profundi]PXY54191.1 flagellar biosynthesis protein FlhF [Virgibacillus profundi]
MKVKKYVAPTMPEVMNQIRKELGSDAVILNSKEVVQGGFFGFFKKKQIEVVAALDPQPVDIKSNKLKGTAKEHFSTRKNADNDNSNTEVLNEIKHLKKIIELQTIQEKNNYTADFKIVHQHLIDQEIQKKLADQVINTVVEKHAESEIKPSYDQIMSDVKMELENDLSELSFEGITYEKKIIHFIGPTGVGKTTTLAKIAANCMLKDHKKVAFITMDTYRIAAIEQLKTYARILDIPIEVAYTMEDYQNAINKLESYDLVLVDTAGRNFRDEKYVNQLKDNMDINLDVDTYLVLALTAKPKDLSEIYDQFYHLPIKGVIFTKIDETKQYGSMLNIAVNKQIGIAYLTNGQDVPDDMLRVTPAVISGYIIGANADA